MVRFQAPETDKMVLGPETCQKCQFLAPENVEMSQQNFWSQKLTKGVSIWGQKPYVMGEWNFTPECFSVRILAFPAGNYDKILVKRNKIFYLNFHI